jgi:peptidoglycan/LPS O-acetylase OafA/YrhL
LALAGLVLLAHSSELVDGDRHREPLTRIFHTMSFGDLAIDGFFILSGFLIVQSWRRDPSLRDFLQKRALRIYPAFVACSLVCAFAVGPLAANAAQYFHEFQVAKFLGGVLILFVPLIPPVFQGTPHPVVNGAMWTIGYEFRCYVMVALFGVLGLLDRRVWLALAAGALFLSLNRALVEHVQFFGLHAAVGDPVILFRFVAFFCAGGCFYLFRERIAYTPRLAILAAAVLLPCMFYDGASQIALATAGAYLLFWLGFEKSAFFKDLRPRADISYGLYLYGWPTQKLLMWFTPLRTPIVLCILTCVISGLCGLLSWHLIEHPFLRRKPQPKAVGVY